MQIYFMKHTSDTNSKWSSRHDALLAFLSEERRTKVLRYAFDDDKILSLYAGLLARMAITGNTGLKNQELSFVSRPQHKPYLLNSRIDFSFSHTRHAVLCGITLEGRIGVDVEPVKNAPLNIMGHVFHPEEIAYIEAGGNEEKDTRFFEIWTKKEAYTKYLGTGLSIDLVAVNTLETSLCNRLFTWTEEDYVCSVCCDALKPFSPIIITEDELSFYFTHSAAHSSGQE